MHGKRMACIRVLQQGRVWYHMALLDIPPDRRAEGGRTVGRRKIAIIALLALLVLLLAGCAKTDKWPRVRIERGQFRDDKVSLPLRDGYIFAEQMYSIQETDKGYDIIIHAVRENNQ